MTPRTPADRVCKLLLALRAGPLTITQLEEEASLQYASACGYLSDLIKHGIVTEGEPGVYALAPGWRWHGVPRTDASNKETATCDETN